MVEDPAFQNLPAFFRLVHPLVRSAPIAVRPDLLDVVSKLAQRSPTETAFFLRQTLALPNSPDTPWVIRQVLSEFPSEIEANLRAAMRSRPVYPPVLINFSRFTANYSPNLWYNPSALTRPAGGHRPAAKTAWKVGSFFLPSDYRPGDLPNTRKKGVQTS